MASDASTNLLRHLHAPQMFPRAQYTNHYSSVSRAPCVNQKSFHALCTSTDPELLRALDPPGASLCPKTIPQAPRIPFDTVFESAPKEPPPPYRFHVLRYSPSTLRTSQLAPLRVLPWGCTEISTNPTSSRPPLFSPCPLARRLLSSLETSFFFPVFLLGILGS